jgi:hypothetical protein
MLFEKTSGKVALGFTVLLLVLCVLEYILLVTKRANYGLAYMIKFLSLVLIITNSVLVSQGNLSTSATMNAFMIVAPVGAFMWGGLPTFINGDTK